VGFVGYGVLTQLTLYSQLQMLRTGSNCKLPLQNIAIPVKPWHIKYFVQSKGCGTKTAKPSPDGWHTTWIPSLSLLSIPTETEAARHEAIKAADKRMTIILFMLLI
jgi:hypothetical protein